MSKPKHHPNRSADVDVDGKAPKGDIDINAKTKAPKAKGSADVDGKGFHFPKFGIGFGGKAKGRN